MTKTRGRPLPKTQASSAWPYVRELALAGGLAGAVLAAYFSNRGFLILLAVPIVTVRGQSTLRPIDWCMFALGVYQIPLLVFSRYPANSARSVTILIFAVSIYFLARLAISTPGQVLVIAVPIGIAGAVAASQVLVQFDRRVELFRAAGLNSIVSLRARLMTVPPPFVAGEWLTLQILVLAIACLPLIAFRRRWLAATFAISPILISTVLILSCSRAVFGALVAFLVTALATGVVYRLASIKALAFSTGITFVILITILFSANSVYHGVLSAYTGRDVSQLRSTEGRIAIWKRSVQIARDNPVWGAGPANAPLFLTADSAEEETIGFAARTFSLPVQILAEQGPPGFLLYAGLLLLLALESHSHMRSAAIAIRTKRMQCCLFSGLVAVCVRELAYSSLLEHAATAMLFSLMAALLVSTGSVSLAQPRSSAS